MAQILVRNLDDGTAERLKQRARAAGRSLEAEVREVLEKSAPLEDKAGRIRRLAELRAAIGPMPDDWPGAEAVIREDRDSR